MNGKSKASNAVYRDDAAELVMAAARRQSIEDPPPFRTSRRSEAPPVRVDAPLAYQLPVGLNDNADFEPPPREVRQFSLPRLLAWIVIAPLYLFLAATSIAIGVLFARSLLGF